MLKKNSIFSRLFISYSLIIVLSFLLFIAVFFYLFHLNLYEEYEEIYQHQYVQVEKQLSNQKEFNWSHSETAEILSYSLYQPGYHIYLVDERGDQIFGPNLNQASTYIPIQNDILNEVMMGNKVSEGGFENGELRYTIATMLSTSIDEVEQPIMVMIFHELNHEYQQVIWMILVTFFIAIMFAGVVLWFMSKRITAPLREMSEIARHYAKGDFSNSVRYQSNDEIGQLAKSFTHMADELNDLETMRRQYISNVSHELRSPLTSIKGFIIALMDGTIPNNRHDYYYRLMKEETERMIKLVNDTLDMNQLEEGHHKLLKTNYNLTHQINTIIDKLEPHCTEKQLQIRLHTNRDYYVNADKERIEQVIVNLLHNAIQFSSSQSVVDIKLTEERPYVYVYIQDNGIGIEEKQLDLIWRRFFKVDEARSNKSGAGLGLAIVKSIIDLHETEIKVQTKPGEGTTFSFNLPLN
ncbi:HAMP domain-containing histidine kinase [Cerasibacillus terrae]|uniref:histidine kinase n=1 Tax=Cerasibacillus terrae TaxID=2498845 RepID=A0A5C8NQN0_9BACI|nr:HAMP domain-containing sensor histidine kinase [Cerasibacillus terrae]TXL64059.1 HAMP domain-containing histidine kinase [Cerasibacillus terrae]